MSARRAALLLVLMVSPLGACAELKSAEREATQDAGLDASPVDDGGASIDAGGTPNDAGVDVDGGASAGYLVFVTSAKVDGSFGAGGDPWAAADAICTNEAKANNLSGTFVAWLSYVDTVGTSFNAITRITEGPYYLPGSVADGGAPILVADTKSELLTTGPRVQLDRLATGTQVDQDENSAVTWVWTGTATTGVAALSSCLAWTSKSASESGVAGNARRIPSPLPTDWTTLGGRTCDVPRRLYCFQK